MLYIYIIYNIFIFIFLILINDRQLYDYLKL